MGEVRRDDEWGDKGRTCHPPQIERILAGPVFFHEGLLSPSETLGHRKHGVKREWVLVPHVARVEPT
jgi:hypothetical protein